MEGSVQRRCPSSSKREGERRARETRGARLYQRRLRDGERAYFHSGPSCSSNSHTRSPWRDHKSCGWEEWVCHIDASERTLVSLLGFAALLNEAVSLYTSFQSSWF